MDIKSFLDLVLAKIVVDTAENEPHKASMRCGVPNRSCTGLLPDRIGSVFFRYTVTVICGYYTVFGSDRIGHIGKACLSWDEFREVFSIFHS